MQFTSFLENGRLTVALSGEIDHHCAKQYIQAIGAKIEAYTPEICILDFEEVTFMDSSGIGLILARYKFCQNCCTSLYVQGINHQTQKVLNLAGIKTIKEITN